MKCPHCNKKEAIYEFTDIGKKITHSCSDDRCFKKAKQQKAHAGRHPG